MRIRTKLIVVVLPILIGALLLAEGVSYRTAVNGVTRVTQQFFHFKGTELLNYADSQGELLMENGDTERDILVSAAQNALERYARSIISSDTEIILALDAAGTPVMTTAPLEISPEEAGILRLTLETEQETLKYAVIGGKERVFQSVYCDPFEWHLLITEEQQALYQEINRKAAETLSIIGGAVLLTAAVLILFSGFLAKSIGKTVKVMQTVIDSGDLSTRAEVSYRDETGTLAHTFNLMISALEKATNQLKQYAFNAVVSQKKEERIRQIFQKYAPKEQIDKFFASPEPMPAGDAQEIAILFSDIRGFSRLAEKMPPPELLESLNRCLSDQVQVIVARNGIVDKYIGDTIMAFWGAPVSHEDDAFQSVLAGLELVDAVKKFNDRQRTSGKPEFKVGVALNYGPAFVGNVGGKQKMEYTVIGDIANTALSMEKLTKLYKEDLLISESIYTAIKNKEPKLAIRLLDTVAVKGGTQGVKIYTVKRSITVPEAKAWGYYHEGMSLYYRRSFEEAVQQFRKALVILHDDQTAEVLIARSLAYADNPPPEDWNGTAPPGEVFTKKR